MREAARKLLTMCTVIAICALGQGSVFAADAAQGKAMAERWCTGCHLVGPQQKSAVTDQAPSFASIAARPDFSDSRLAFLLLSPHPNMPNLALSRSEISNLADYIRTLK